MSNHPETSYSFLNNESIKDDVCNAASFVPDYESTVRQGFYGTFCSISINNFKHTEECGL